VRFIEDIFPYFTKTKEKKYREKINSNGTRIPSSFADNKSPGSDGKLVDPSLAECNAGCVVVITFTAAGGLAVFAFCAIMLTMW
jgi:hypothetical protein